MIHPDARPIISSLSIPSPIKKYFSDQTWNIDLSNNTNPYMNDFAEYPDVKQTHLKELYLKTILSLNPPAFLRKDPSLTPDNVLFTSGSMEGLDVLLRTFAEPNKDIVCIPSPSFPAYEHWSLLHNLKVKKFPILGDNLDHFSSEEILEGSPKIVFLCTPNNPTGTSLKPEIIHKLCTSLQGFIVVDEAYIEFSDQPSALFYLNQYKNLILLRTFSKAWGLAGVRCGAILADTSIIETLRYVQLPFSVSSPSQTAIEERLRFPEKAFASWQKIKKNRQNLTGVLSSHKKIVKVFHSEANFIMVILKDFASTMDKLKHHKIQVLDCSASLPDSIRVSLGTEEQNKAFLRALS